ncbi:MAG: hypothetical protein ACI4RP_02250 [Acutalibacteraceae bacterium]
MKRKILAVLIALMMMLIPTALCSCGESSFQSGEYISSEPYLYINITDADSIIDYSGKINLNGDDCDIVFSVNRESRHFEIRQDDSVVYEGYYSTEDNGEKLLLKTNETSFTLERQKK